MIIAAILWVVCPILLCMLLQNKTDWTAREIAMMIVSWVTLSMLWLTSMGALIYIVLELVDFINTLR